MNLFNPSTLKKLLFLFLVVLTAELNAHSILTVKVDEMTVVEPDTIMAGRLLKELMTNLEAGYYTETADRLSEKVEEILESGQMKDKLFLSDGYFAVGVNSIFKHNNARARQCFEISMVYREEISLIDQRYAKSLSNLSTSLFNLGDYTNALKYGEKALSVKRRIVGEDSTTLVINYLNLASSKLQLYDLDGALEYAEAGLAISKLYPDRVKASIVADLYQDIALGLLRKNESAKALDYAKQALSLYAPYDENKPESWVLMFNTISHIYNSLNMPEKAEEYYRLGLKQADSDNILYTYLLSISFSGFLSDMAHFEQAGDVLEYTLSLIAESNGKGCREYAITNASYSSLLFLKNKESLKISQHFKDSFGYLESHPWDSETRNIVLKVYAETLYKAGLYRDAIEIVNKMLKQNGSFSVAIKNKLSSADIVSREIEDGLKIKYMALNALAQETGSHNYTIQAIETGELLTSIFDYNRMEMSEDESRTKFSGNARSFYTGLMGNYYSLYSTTGDNVYLEKAFEISEKSKVAGFLAATRQVNATRFSVPENLAEIDNNLRKKLGLNKEFIANEKTREKPDSFKIAVWEREAFSLLRTRDSLVAIFEKDYPEFYKLRYNSSVSSMKEVTKIIGREENLLSYVMTDNRLFIFVINKKYNEVIVKKIDKDFIAMMERFRHIISTIPDPEQARASFNEYMTLSHELYKVLIAPAEPFLISDRLTISPDNILSYIPFETLITDSFSSNEMLYREAPYVLKKYRLSYIYSVTLSSETRELNLHLRNSLIAFAPSYDAREVSDSLLIHYPGLRGSISNLPYAFDEANDVVSQCGGVAYTGKAATEEMFKRQAPDYDIIHLAMHTLVNDQEPSYSKMIFSRCLSSEEDDLLNTYEVYNIPLKARMVVLSSCNTGSGKLTSGEGIQSLARGFIFSGGHSVVTSMWEVEDFAGFEVVKLFYKNIIKGNSKSQALRKARIQFLENADQQRSHPYYWSTLVVYGDDSPLYYNKFRVFAAFASLTIALSLLFFLFYKDPRS